MIPNPTIKEYLATIVRKGGSASRGKPSAKERARKAAKARWAKRPRSLPSDPELKRTGAF